MGQKIMQVSEVFLDSVADTLLLALEGLKLWAENDRNQSKEFSCLVISLYTQPFPSGKREFRLRGRGEGWHKKMRNPVLGLIHLAHPQYSNQHHGRLVHRRTSAFHEDPPLGGSEAFDSLSQTSVS